MGPRAGLDGRKISSLPGFDPGPSSPSQSLYGLSYPAHYSGMYIRDFKTFFKEFSGLLNFFLVMLVFSILFCNLCSLALTSPVLCFPHLLSSAYSTGIMCILLS